jgi:hypothetical protein
MIKASATTEHASKGQTGQPAACMIENKGFLGRRTAARDYVRWRSAAKPASVSSCWRHSSTVSVDNFVYKRARCRASPRQRKRSLALPTK